MKFLITLTALVVLCGCKKTTSDVYSHNEEQVKRQDSLFSNVDKKWIFTPLSTPKNVEQKISEWKDWHALLAEISSKPLSSLSAFRQEAANFVLLGDKLSSSVPEEFNTPAIQSRIALLNTNLQRLDMYMHLDQIPDKKIAEILSQSNKNMQSIINQIEVILLKKSIPKEEGEDRLYQNIDTVKRATTQAMP